jgi:hypothetical protein
MRRNTLVTVLLCIVAIVAYYFYTTQIAPDSNHEPSMPERVREMEKRNRQSGPPIEQFEKKMEKRMDDARVGGRDLPTPKPS